MFTGIVETIARVDKQTQSGICIENPWAPTDVILGQSIAVNGCCLTVTSTANHTLTFDCSPETLNKTIFSKPLSFVNLERCLKVGDRLDGHYVTGHVDGLVTLLKKSIQDQSEVWVIGGMQSDAMKWVITKGSITINGVSLTVNDVFKDSISVSIIPYTLAHTTFHLNQINDHLHVEYDLMGKYAVQTIEKIKIMERNV